MNPDLRCAPGAAPLLSVEALHHAFGPTEVLHDLHLGLCAGEVVALLGPSGGGKTTLLHLLAGLTVVQRGRVVCRAQRRVVLFQQPRLLPWQRTRDNIALGLRAQGVERCRARRQAEAMGQALGLDETALQAYPHQLSGGMQSRAALARALVLEPDLLLMDEPFAALDIGLKAQLHRRLLEQRRRTGCAVLMITHDVIEAMRLADRVLVLAAGPGRLVHEHRPDLPADDRNDADAHHGAAQLLSRPEVRRVFDLP